MRSKTLTKTTRKQTIQQQETLHCSVCGKEFNPNNVARFIIAGGRTCSWKCFLDEVRKRDAERETKKKK